MTDRRVDPLTAALPPVLRRVEPPAAPWPASLVGGGGGDGHGYLVDAALLPDGAFGDPAEHVLRPVELLRTGDGHLVRMPPVVRRLDPAPSGDGAAVTLAVSIVRAAAAGGCGLPGEWWCDADGRPVFVPVAGAPSLAEGAAALLHACDLGEAQTVLDELATELLEPEPLPLDGWEDRLFAVATPAPLQRPTVETRAALRRSGAPRARRAGTAAGFRDVVSDAGVSAWRTARRLRGDRRLVLGVAAAAAVLVVAVGLALPDGSESPATVPAPAQSADAVAPGPTEQSPAAPTGDDPVAHAVALLDRARACGDDRSCLGGVMEDPATALPPGPARDDAAAQASLVDDLGGIAVVRVDGEDGTSQIVLIVARDDEWLVRDVYDAADQP